MRRKKKNSGRGDRDNKYRTSCQDLEKDASLATNNPSVRFSRFIGRFVIRHLILCELSLTDCSFLGGGKDFARKATTAKSLYYF